MIFPYDEEKTIIMTFNGFTFKKSLICIIRAALFIDYITKQIFLNPWIVHCHSFVDFFLVQEIYGCYIYFQNISKIHTRVLQDTYQMWNSHFWNPIIPWLCLIYCTLCSRHVWMLGIFTKHIMSGSLPGKSPDLETISSMA